MSKQQQAVEIAKLKFSDLQEIEPGRWTYYVWSDSQRAWLAPVRVESYKEARRKRIAGIASVAVHTMLQADPPDEDLTWRIIRLAYASTSGGKIEERVTEILDRLH